MRSITKLSALWVPLSGENDTLIVVTENYLDSGLRSAIRLASDLHQPGCGLRPSWRFSGAAWPFILKQAIRHLAECSVRPKRPTAAHFRKTR
jgi:hypothetical protein